MSRILFLEILRKKIYLANSYKVEKLVGLLSLIILKFHCESKCTLLFCYLNVPINDTYIYSYYSLSLIFFICSAAKNRMHPLLMSRLYTFPETV